MFWNKDLLYRGTSIERYNEIKDILELNNIKYKIKIENKNKDIGTLIDKAIIGRIRI